jgi:hypothetical protein
VRSVGGRCSHSLFSPSPLSTSSVHATSYPRTPLLHAESAAHGSRFLEHMAVLAGKLHNAVVRNKQLEREVGDLEKEVAMREEMETALKEGLREAERSAKLMSCTGVDVQYLKNTVRTSAHVERVQPESLVTLALPCGPSPSQSGAQDVSVGGGGEPAPRLCNDPGLQP